MPRSSRATTRALLAAVVAVATLSGCSDDAPTPAPAPETTAAPAAWNPCSGLDAARVSTLFATTYAVRTGTASAPTCTFSPQVDGDPALDINYQQIVGNLKALLETFGKPSEQTTVVVPKIAGASGARLIVDTSGDTVAITAFVRVDRLVQVVNLLDPEPYRRAELIKAVESLMADLAANADSSGLTG